tara:strand:+ start:5428 stop:6375 length:948 start_codon:yes stop_codon:yes gene_type:complete
MAQPTNLYDTYDTTGIREDLVNVIYNVSPEDTPILSAIPRAVAKSTKHEWQLDALATPATNAVIEGDEATVDAMTATTRAFNYCQISDKVIAVSGTQSAVDAAGRADEMAYQIAKKSKELKKDMEFDLIEPNVQVAGSATAARELGSIPTWIKTNGDAGTSGSLSTGSGTDLPGSGTDRDLTEAILKTVIKEVYTSGGDMDMLVCPPSVKQVISGFNANTTRFGPAGDKTEYAAIDVYSSDFGDLKIVPNRVMATTDAKDVFIIQRDMLATAYLRDFMVQDLSKTGDSDKKQLLVEYTLEVRNEAAHGIILDINQ